MKPRSNFFSNALILHITILYKARCEHALRPHNGHHKLKNYNISSRYQWLFGVFPSMLLYFDIHYKIVVRVHEDCNFPNYIKVKVIELEIKELAL